MNLLMGAMMLGSMLLLSLRLTGFFSPSSLMLAVWFFEFVAQYWSGFYMIELKTVVFLVLFIMFFVVGTFLGYSIKFKKSNYTWSENKVYRIIKLVFMLLVVVVPFVYLDIRNSIGFDVTNIAQSVRLYYVDSFAAGQLPLTIKILANFSIVLVVLVFVCSNIKLPTKIFYIICGLGGATAVFSKGYPLLMLCYIFSIKIFQSRRPHFLIAIAAVFSAFLILIFFGFARGDIDIVGIDRYFRIYFLSSVPAFQLIVNGDFHFPFPMLFGFMKPIFELIGVNPSDGTSDSNYVEVPDPTNVFTAFGPAFSDYGALFTLFYFMINGFISGIVFNLAKSNYMLFKILYGLVLFAIATSIFSDAFAFRSTIFNYLLVFLIIHLYARTRNKNRNFATI